METFFYTRVCHWIFFAITWGFSMFMILDVKTCPSHIKPLMINVLHLCKAWHNTMRFHLAMHTNEKKIQGFHGKENSQLAYLYIYNFCMHIALHLCTYMLFNEKWNIFYVWCSSGQLLMMIILMIPCLKMHKTRTTWLLWWWSFFLLLLPT